MKVFITLFIVLNSAFAVFAATKCYASTCTITGDSASCSEKEFDCGGTANCAKADISSSNVDTFAAKGCAPTDLDETAVCTQFLAGLAIQVPSMKDTKCKASLCKDDLCNSAGISSISAITISVLTGLVMKLTL